MPKGIRLASILLLAALSGACTTAGGSAAPAAPTPTPAAATPTAAPATPIPTTATAWGPIRDAVPPSFPRYPGAGDTTTDAAVSAALTTGTAVATVRDWYQAALAARGYTTRSTSRPAEDGSVVAEFDGSRVATGCRAQLTYRPQGTQTLITVLYGAACPTA